MQNAKMKKKGFCTTQVFMDSHSLSHSLSHSHSPSLLHSHSPSLSKSCCLLSLFSLSLLLKLYLTFESIYLYIYLLSCSFYFISFYFIFHISHFPFNFQLNVIKICKSKLFFVLFSSSSCC